MHDPDDPNPPAAILPPILDPARYDEYAALRETFLLHFSEPTANAALRKTADLFYQLILEAHRVMPLYPEGMLRSEVRAVVADLRFMQGYLAEMGEDLSGPTDVEKRLRRLLSSRAKIISKVADEIEAELATIPKGQP